VIVGDFYVVSILVFPAKADTEPVIGADAVLAGAIAFQCFEAVAWRKPQLLERHSGFDLGKLAECCLEDRRREVPWPPTKPKCVGGFVGSGLNHGLLNDDACDAG